MNETLGVDIDPMDVLWVYFQKHMLSIATAIKQWKSTGSPDLKGGEDLSSRIHDARNYLGLLEDLIEDLANYGPVESES